MQGHTQAGTFAALPQYHGKMMLTVMYQYSIVIKALFSLLFMNNQPTILVANSVFSSTPDSAAF